MASITIQKHTLKSASGGQISHIYRTHKNYSNKDINPELTKYNLYIGNSEQAKAGLRQRIAEVDEILPPQRKRKDRVVTVSYVAPMPEGDYTREQVKAFFTELTKGLCEEFGKENFYGGAIHFDEVHEYTDVDGTKKMSRPHLHLLAVPFVEGKGINGKDFLKKETYSKVNAIADKVCQEMFGKPYQDGSKQRSRGTVEQLKEGEKQAKALIEHYKEQNAELIGQVKALTENIAELTEKAANLKKQLEIDRVRHKEALNRVNTLLDGLAEVQKTYEIPNDYTEWFNNLTEALQDLERDYGEY